MEMIQDLIRNVEMEFEPSFWLALGPALKKGRGFLSTHTEHPQTPIFLLRLTYLLTQLDSEEAINIFWDGLADPQSQSVFKFLRDRHVSRKMAWQKEFFDRHIHTELCFLPSKERKASLQKFDATFRHGTLKKARVIKQKGLGLSCQILEVLPHMEEQEIRDQFLQKIKAVHPDIGGSHHQAQEIIRAYANLKSQINTGNKGA